MAVTVSPLLGAEPMRLHKNNAEFENLLSLRDKGLTGFSLNHNHLRYENMSSTSKSITPAPSMPGIDWARFKTPELDSDIEDNDEIAAAKAKERRRRGREASREEEEKRRREEEERRRREEEEVELRKREEEQRKCEEAQRKAAEANKKRQRDEGEAGPSAVPVSEPWCIRCAGAGVTCEFINDGNKRRTACKRCAAMREKCEWPEMDMSGPGKDKGKGKQVPTSPRQGEKKKRVRKAKAQKDDEVEIVGERMAEAGPSRVSLDRLVLAIEELSDRMGELVQAHRESTQAHWDSTQAHWESTQAHRESTLASRKARRAFEVFVDEAAICGAPEESPEESEEEEVDEGEIDEELAGLEEDKAENPMSPPKV
ncbi:hypothetical protein BU15DRAFT_84066 [Melanogaster broomeanus]|nr:hypothetical protein BU15DRAFT_84066 [Melanogaster broomeanus]